MGIGVSNASGQKVTPFRSDPRLGAMATTSPVLAGINAGMSVAQGLQGMADTNQKMQLRDKQIEMKDKQISNEALRQETLKVQLDELKSTADVRAAQAEIERQTQADSNFQTTNQKLFQAASHLQATALQMNSGQDTKSMTDKAYQASLLEVFDKTIAQTISDPKVASALRGELSTMTPERLNEYIKSTGFASGTYRYQPDGKGGMVLDETSAGQLARLKILENTAKVDKTISETKKANSIAGYYDKGGSGSKSKPAKVSKADMIANRHAEQMSQKYGLNSLDEIQSAISELNSQDVADNTGSPEYAKWKELKASYEILNKQGIFTWGKGMQGQADAPAPTEASQVVVPDAFLRMARGQTSSDGQSLEPLLPLLVKYAQAFGRDPVSLLRMAKDFTFADIQALQLELDNK